MKRLSTFFLMLMCLAACQKAPQLTITSSPSIELNNDGGSDSITFTANRDWTVSSSSPWVTVSPSSGAASDEPITIIVRCDANTAYDDRTATVTIRMEELTQTITVKQSAKKGLIVPTQSYEIDSTGGTINVEVQANIQYSIDISADWIKQTGTKALTSETLTFSIENNETNYNREGKIIVKSERGEVSDQEIVIKQAKKVVLTIDQNVFELLASEGQVTVKIETSAEIDVEPTVDWIKPELVGSISYYDGNGNIYGLAQREYVLTVSMNPNQDSREGTVAVKQQGNGAEDMITIKQAGRILVTSIELNKSSLSLHTGDSEMLIATLKPESATDKTVTWLSSDDSVASVNVSGRVTANKEGQATITAKIDNQIAYCSVTVLPKEYVSPDAVDLGLSVKWASYNLGATKPEECGDYYAWGETTTKSIYKWDTYEWGHSRDQLVKYCPLDFSHYWGGSGSPDGKTVLDPEDDVAHVRLGENWRMPTKQEQDALRTQCTWTWTAKNGVYGYEVKSKVNSNSIFLPVTSSTGSGAYWSSSLSQGGNPDSAYMLGFDSGNRFWANMNRFSGLAVRPVSE